ncbi:MAG: sulfotransferase family 2 domain-containing protein [Pseudomonadota bacterium]
MIISRGRNYIFVHAPKTGGTSMALALEARAMKDDLMLGDTPKALKRRRRLKDAEARGRLWKHSTLADIDGLVSAEEVAQMFIFTLVRNPWDRLVSYYHWLQSQRFDHPAVALAQQLEFRAFAQAPHVVASLKASPARHYVTDAAGTERCNAFLRIEHLAEDIAPLEAHLGFALEVPRANKSDRDADWRCYYDTASADSVAAACAEDIVRFGYRFDGASG